MEGVKENIPGSPKVYNIWGERTLLRLFRLGDDILPSMGITRSHCKDTCETTSLSRTKKVWIRSFRFFSSFFRKLLDQRGWSFDIIISGDLIHILCRSIWCSPNSCCCENNSMNASYEWCFWTVTEVSSWGWVNVVELSVLYVLVVSLSIYDMSH